MNYIDRSKLVPWRFHEFNPKRYFKLFYNISIFFLPIATIIISLFLNKLIKFKSMVVLPGEKTKKKILIKFDKIQDRFSKISRFISRYHIIVLIALLIVVLFNFGYLLETGIWINYYHHNFIIATINDLFHGKYLLINTFSQYGMLFPYLLYLIFHVFYFSYTNLYLLFMIFTIVYYFILYYLLLVLTNKKVLSLVALFTIMGINTLFNYPTYPVSENYVWPGATVLRYFFDIIVFFLIFKNKNFSSKKLNFLIAGLVSFSILYNVETGMALYTGYIILIILHTFSKKGLSINKKIFYLLKLLVPILFFSILFPLLFSLLTYFSSGRWPDWNIFFQFIRLANEGISNINTPLIDWYLGYLGLYFAVIIFILHGIINQKKSLNWDWIVIGGISFYGLVLMNYYISRSVNSNLAVVGAPAGIIFFFVLNKLQNSKESFLQWLKIFITFLVIVVSCISTFFLIKRLNYRLYSFNHVNELKKYPGNRGFVVVSYIENKGFTVDDLLKSVAQIKKLTKGSERIMLFSRWDSVIMVMSEKTHIIDRPLLEQIYYKDELNKLKNQLVVMKNKPKFMFVDKINTVDPPPTSYYNAKELFKAVLPFYTFYKEVGILDIYKLKDEAI